MSVTDVPYENASASVLSRQPPTLPQKIAKYNPDWTQIFSHLESRLGMMRSWRYSWWTYWATLAEFILPRRYHWLVTANLMRRGSPINQAIIDSTATLAMNICAAGMVEGLTPTTREWVKLSIGVPGAEASAEDKAWLEDTEQRLYTILGGSNFYSILAQAAQDEVTFGTSPVICYEDAEDVIRLYSPCAGEYYLAVGSRFSVDTLYREFTLTVAQIVEMFTLEACPSSIRELWNSAGGSLEMEFVVAHAIEPNFPLASRGSTKGKINVCPQSFPYREVYWLRGQKTDKALSVRGFHKKPFAVFRWSTVSNDPYGRGPGMDALGDVKQLQTETRRKAEGIEKQVRPPMGADPEMKNEPTSILPAHITYTSSEGGKKGFWPLYEVRPDLSGLTADMKEIQSRIDRCFLVDVWMAISQMEGVQPRNNLEIAERKAEKMQRLGPVVGLWKTEGMQPLLERVLDIMQRKKMLKPMPKSLQGIPLKFNFIDMVTLAQLGSETASMEQTFKIGGELSEAAKAAQLPDPLRCFNLDESIRIYADRMTFPAKGLFTADEVAQHDQARMKAKQQAQMPAQIQAGVQAAVGLSKADLGGNNALTALTGQQPQAGSGP